MSVSVALDTQHTRRMRRIVLSSVACLARSAENTSTLHSKVLVYFCLILMELELP